MPTLVVQHPDTEPSVRYHLPSDLDVMDDEVFFAWCQDNGDARIERSANGEIEIMAPSGWETGSRNNELSFQLTAWAKQDGRGIACDSSTGYILPNRAERSPDASWILRERVKSVPKEQREKFLPLCPDFVIELLSPSDSVRRHQEKMVEYIANGASLGWLIDPFKKEVHVYRSGAGPEILKLPAAVSGEGLTAGFTLDLSLVFSVE